MEERDETFFVNNEPAENSFNEQDLNSIESELTEEFQEVKHSKTRRMLKIGGIVSIVICVLLIIIVPTTVILPAKTTAVASSTPSAEVTATTSTSTTRKPTVIPTSTPAASESTGFPTVEPDTFTTMPISRSTSSTKSTISPSSVSPEILATTDGDHETTTFETASRETTGSLIATTTSSTLSNENTTATHLRTTEEKRSAQSTTEISTSTTLVTPVLSTTTSYETTTVSVVEEIGECEYVNELLGVDICVLDARYPLKHCNKNDQGCYELEGKCVHSIYMDWTLCGDYFGWDECEDDETEEPELIFDWCEQ